MSSPGSSSGPSSDSAHSEQAQTPTGSISGYGSDFEVVLADKRAIALLQALEIPSDALPAPGREIRIDRGLIGMLFVVNPATIPDDQIDACMPPNRPGEMPRQSEDIAACTRLYGSRHGLQAMTKALTANSSPRTSAAVPAAPFLAAG